MKKSQTIAIPQSASKPITKYAMKKLNKHFGIRGRNPISQIEKKLNIKITLKTADAIKRKAYRMLAEQYNNIVEIQNTEIDKKQKLDKNNKNKIYRFVSGKTKSFTLSDYNNKDIINNMKRIHQKGIKSYIKYGKKKYAINDRTIDYLKKKLIDGEYDGFASSSDDEMVDYIEDGGDVSFHKFEYSGGNLIEGGFFPYSNTIIDIDLSADQIYYVDDENISSITKKMNEDESCFIKSLINSQMVDMNEINQIKIMCKSRNLPMKKIKQICEERKIHITVRRPEDKSNLKHYGDKTLAPINLGLIDGHYIFIQTVPYTSYCVKHYDEIKDKSNWNNITGIIKDKVIRSSNKFITNYQLILLMKELGHFKELDRRLLLETTYYDVNPVLNLSKELNGQINEKDIMENEFKEKEQKYDFKNIYFDFETITEGTHIPYMVRFSIGDGDKTHFFYGEDCGYKMLNFIHNTLKLKYVKMIAHNVGYDIRFLYKYLYRFNLIQRGNMVLSGSAMFKKMNIKFQDSYALIPAPLRNFGKMFKLNVEKEVLPYSLYTKQNVKDRYIPLSVCLKECKEDDKELYVENCKKWDCITDDKKVDIIKYSDEYCKIDVLVLKRGYETFQKWIEEVCELDIDDYVSLPSLANDYMLKQGVFDDVYKVGGVVREFIQKCVIGGRTMCAENKKHFVHNMVLNDFDAVSLYPSAMNRLGGYLKGKPKIITNFEETKQNADGYFVKIKITNVGKSYKFPLMSKIDKETSVRNFTNDMVGEYVYVDKTMLDDWVQYQQIEYEFVEGLYYDAGRNYTLKTVINHLFDERKRQKKNKNPIENVYKLLMNSAYGKTILKEIDEEIKYIPAKELNDFMCKYYNHIKECEEINETSYVVKMYKSVSSHFNNSHCGVEVLSTSKRIMNEVMTTAEDNKIDMFYTDTDSIHIDDNKVNLLGELFTQKYGRELIGKEMGQFHCDFDMNAKDPVSILGIFLGKKCYIDKLEGTDDNGNKIYDYHIRMKGISNQAIKHKCKMMKIEPEELYTKLYNGDKIKFDLCCGGEKKVFEKTNNDFSIFTKENFIREVSF